MAARNATDKFFNVLEELVEVDEGELSLDVGVLAQVAPRVRLLGTERFLNTEDVSQTREARLEVELRRLSEVGLFSVVVESEQGCTSFDLGLNHARRGNFEEVEVGVGFAERGEEGGADLENG